MPSESGYCILCEGPKDAVGVFVPNDDRQRDVGFSVDRPTAITYGICDRCMSIDNWTDRVESKLFAYFAVDRQ